MAPTTITTTKGDSAHTYNTTGTVSSPLNLDSFLTPRGEHETVNLTGSSHAKKIRPKPKVTLTALTVNNVSGNRTTCHAVRCASGRR